MDDIETVLTEQYVKHLFDALPPSHQKEYLKWINEAKKPETRAARIRKMAEMLKAPNK